MEKNKNSQIGLKSIVAFLAAAIFVSSISIGHAKSKEDNNGKNELTTIDKITGSIDYSIDEKSLNRDLVLDSRDNEIDANTEISIIVELDGSALIDTYKKAGYENVSDYAKSKEGKAKANINLKNQKKLINSLAKKDLISEVTSNYSILLNAITVKTEYKNLTKIESFSGVKNVIISSNYEKPKTMSGSTGAVFNDANVYETGIYDSSDVEYTGEGTVVSVLDTGCDYTHSAFQTAPLNPRLSREDINDVLEYSMAYSVDKSITVNDVYYSEKIPFGFDYADGDSNIYPLLEDHGTHVAGIIGGQDDVITGVAVNAQLVIMKVFPDSESGASTEGILQALEDSVLLGVDVINMSLGSTIGFTREEDDEYINDVYEKIEEAGISLDVAAGNEYSGGYGGDFSNTNYAYNPDSGVVGSPSTYKPAMAVASINGILEPYVEANDGETTAFLTPAAHMNGDEYDFVGMLGLSADGLREKEFEYVTVPGYGMQANYSAIDVKGKIALVKRGSNTFAEKIAYAEAAGAIGILIYNNVTGTIKMSAGDNVNIAVASISRAAGDEMAKHSKGKIKVSVDQKAGPFMSDFSSWGPTPSLELKPEITAHGGNITSSVIGGGYDVLSGTSMATPNLAGVSALMIEYLNKTKPELNSEERLALINQIQMSTSAIVLNEEGNPYSPRKQGSGLANLYSSINTKAYLSVDGSNKTKIELYDDPDKTGIYDMSFNLVNMSSGALSFTVVPYTMTESMSSDNETIAELAYMLDPKMEVTVEGNGTYESSAKKVTVNPNTSVKLNVTLTLSDKDKDYLDKTFENGMFVEGFIELQSLEENINEKDNIDLSIPYLGFYGNWAQAPIFDKDIFEVQSTEFDNSINEKDKIKADYYATTYYGKYYDYYIIPLGSYIYEVDSSYDRIPASQDRAAITNSSSGINGLADAYLGMLRSAKKIDVQIIDVSTGKVIYEETQNNQRKTFYNGSAGTTSPSFVDFDFDPVKLGLANNTQYRITIDATLDYKTTDGNKKSSISCDFFIDNEAPTVVDSRFYKEWDKTTEKYRSYVEIDVYDNRYAQAIRLGTIENGTFSALTKYPIPIYQENPNETTTVKIEITDYLSKIYATEYSDQLVVVVDDYALNSNLFLIPLGETGNPDFTFENGEAVIDVTLSPNQVFDIESLTTEKYGTFIEGLVWESTNENVAKSHEGKIIAIKEGNATITGKNLYQIEYESNGKNYDKVKALKLTVNVTVLGESDVGYVEYDKPQLEKIGLKSVTTIKAFTDDYENTDLVENGYYSYFDSSKSLSVYPSEQFKLDYTVEPWTISSDRYTINWKSSNNKVAVVDQDGIVTAMGKGTANITLSITIDGRDYTQTDTLRLTVKDPFVVTGTVLMAYKGFGGVVEVPDNLGLMYIYPYAFSLYTYASITDEAILYNPVGNDTITKIIIPEGVEQIMEGAFSGCTALEEVVLPSSLRTIEKKAFKDCPNLKTVNLNYVEKIGDNAFENCPKLQLNATTDLQKTATIGINAFKGCTSLTNLNLSNIGYAGKYTFEGATSLSEVELGYLSKGMFKNSGIKHITISASLIPEGLFEGCTSLETVTFTNTNVVISENAFAGATNLTEVRFAENSNVVFNDLSFANTKNLKVLNLPNGTIDFNGNVFFASGLEKLNIGANTLINKIESAPFENTTSFTTIEVSLDSSLYTSVSGILFDNDNKLLLVPTNIGETIVLPDSTISIGESAFAGNKTVKTINTTSNSQLVKIGNYAFYNSNIEVINLPNNTIEIGNNAFAECTQLVSITNLDKAILIGDSAFENSTISNVVLGEGVVIGNNAFARTTNITEIDIPANAKIGSFAFEDSNISTVNFIGAGVVLGDYAFKNNDKLTTIDLTNVISIGNGIFMDSGRLNNVNLGTNITIITEEMFANCLALKSIDLTNVTEIEAHAFEGAISLARVTNTEKLTTVGYYAFVNCQSLKTIDLSNVTEFGSFAFANAYSLENVNISKAEILGEELFNNNKSLTTVVLNENLNELSRGIFYNCISLKTINADNLRTINENAFALCSSLTKVTLTNATVIEDYAFYSSGLARVSLPVTTKIGEFAFAKSKIKLLSMSVVEKIDTYAFAMTALVGDVKLPESLTYLGDLAFVDNPYIERFVSASSNSDTEKVNDYILLDKGVLYTKIADGYQLIAYPEAKKDSKYSIVEGTTKIASYAVAFQHYLKEVELPYSLKYISDFAFAADVDKNGNVIGELSVFIFNSYKAPVLEGVYNDNYEYAIEYYDENGNKTLNMEEATEARLSDKMAEMYKYSMYYDYYCYSNFIGYVGQVENLTIKYPKNGIGYDGIIYNWYFDEKELMPAVMSDVTLGAYNAITALKDAEDITLDDEADVVNARVLYSYIDEEDSEQLALVTNYDRLIAAEAKIKDLKPFVVDDITQKVYDMIENLKNPSELEWTDRYDVEEIRAFYNLITDSDQLAYLTNINKLLAAEEKIEELRIIQTMPTNVLAVYNAIISLPDEVTLDDEAAIIATRTEYDSLTDTEKLQLSSYVEKLLNAEKALANLKTNNIGNNSNNTGLIIGIVVGVVLVAGVAVFIVLKKKKNN